MPGSANTVSMITLPPSRAAMRMDRSVTVETMEFEGTSGGGVVKITVTGQKQVTKVELQPEAVDPDDIEMLQDLILTATNEALKKVDEYSGVHTADDNKVMRRVKRAFGLGMERIIAAPALIYPAALVDAAVGLAEPVDNFVLFHRKLKDKAVALLALERESAPIGRFNFLYDRACIYRLAQSEFLDHNTTPVF